MVASQKCLTLCSFHEAYDNDGAKGRSSHSKSPSRPPYAGKLYNSYAGHNQSIGGDKNDGWDTERQGPDMQSNRGPDIESSRQFEHPMFSQTLEDLELEYKREAIELGRIRDKEEDEENYKHRETIREMRENYIKKLTQLRGVHAKQWEEFLQLDAQRRQQQALEQMSASSFGGYKQHNYSGYDGTSTNSRYAGASLPMDARGRYPNSMENYPSRPHDTYGGFQRQRREDFGKAYNRY